ncbi:MAG TPA: class I SAM-dependent methyltransferase [Gemmatimonadaceae bacterium]|jgi:SAM-dependent methyltransferase
MRKLARRLRRLLSPTLRRPDAIAPDEREAGIDFIYRFVLARPVDEEGRARYARRMRDEGMTLREVAAEIAASDEFQTRLRNTIPRDMERGAGEVLPSEAAVDASTLSATLTVEELARTADDYYRTTLQFADRYLAKPFADPRDTPDLLGSFAHLLSGLQLVPGMTVLDFGAGACWTTRCLTQLGCAAIAVDVSPTALALGQQLFARLPPIGSCPPPRFLVFDGRRIDLPDASVDRIFCFDAFHHVPNPAEVMCELGRVLVPGGIAGFSEPGPHHSKGARSQYEMKNYTAIENDVVMEDVWTWARAAGFVDLALGVFSTEDYRVPLPEFEELTRGGRALSRYAERVRVFLHGHQTFFLRKGGQAVRDSREREGLKGEIGIRLAETTIEHEQPIRGTATVQNVGSVRWLPGSTRHGGVNLGVHLRRRDGQPIALDFARIPLDGITPPGETRTVEFAIAAPETGEYLLEFDLVSEGVGWFEMNGSATVTVAIVMR